jgi:hypothetical protein
VLRPLWNGNGSRTFQGRLQSIGHFNAEEATQPTEKETDRLPGDHSGTIGRKTFTEFGNFLPPNNPRNFKYL